MTTIKVDAKSNFASIDTSDGTELFGVTADILYAISEFYKMIKEKYNACIADACIETIKQNVEYMKDQATMEENVRNNTQANLQSTKQKYQMLIDANGITKDELDGAVHSVMDECLSSLPENESEAIIKRTMNDIMDITI